MAEWNKGKVLPSAINGGKEFTESDNLALDELNAIVNNSFYAAELVENSIAEVNNAAAQGKAELGLAVEQGKSELGDVVGDASELVEDAKNHINTVVDTANRAEETAKLAEEKIDSFIKTNGGTLVYVEGELKTLWRADFVENERKKSKNLFDVNAFLNKSEHTTVNGNVITQAAGGNGELDSIWDLIPVSEFYVYQGGLSGFAYFSMNIKTTGDRIVRLRFYDKNRNIVVPTKIPEYWIYDDSYKCVYKKFNNEEVVGSCRLDHLDPNDGIEYFAFCTLWLPQEQTISNVMFTVYNDIVELSDYQPYHGQITHNGDAPVVFAEAERQKGKNLLCLKDSSASHTGLTITTNAEDQTITINGTATNDSDWLANQSNVLPKIKNYAGKQVTMSANVVSGSTTNGALFALCFSDDPWYDDWAVTDVDLPKDNAKASKTFVVPSDKAYDSVRLFVAKNSTFNNLVVKLQIEDGGTATDWKYPYGAIVHEKDIEDVEHIETIYDSSSSDSNINKGYTNGLMADEGSTIYPFGLTSQRYKAFIIYFKIDDCRLSTRVVTKNNWNTVSVACGDYYSSSNAFNTFTCRIFEDGGFSCLYAKYHYGSQTTDKSNDSLYVVTRIEGVLK